MKYPVFLLIIILHIQAVGQTKLSIKMTINGANNFDFAFLFYPIPKDTVNASKLDIPIALKCDSMNIEASKINFIDTSNRKTKLFYCIYNNNKSRIYNLDTDKIIDGHINFVIPDHIYYDSIYKYKICPLCHSNKNVIPLLYGKVGKEGIKQAQRGQIKLAGCSLSNISPKLYCKADMIEF